jgi:hypothetical protein
MATAMIADCAPSVDIEFLLLFQFCLDEDPATLEWQDDEDFGVRSLPRIEVMANGIIRVTGSAILTPVTVLVDPLPQPLSELQVDSHGVVVFSPATISIPLK